MPSRHIEVFMWHQLKRSLQQMSLYTYNSMSLLSSVFMCVGVRFYEIIYRSYIAKYKLINCASSSSLYLSSFTFYVCTTFELQNFIDMREMFFLSYFHDLRLPIHDAAKVCVSLH